MLGLKRGEVTVVDHQTEWEEIAAATIRELKEIFGDTALDIQHIGSTAIHSIKSKPIIDIAVGIETFESLTDVLLRLEKSGIYTHSHNRFNQDLLYVINDAENKRTHQIHILEIRSPQWRNYVDFRNYMNSFPEKAKEYENLKIELTQKCDNIQTDYTDGKKEYMDRVLYEARIYAEMKQKFEITVFEPITKGWSSDKKYYIKTATEQQMFLRISNISEFDRKKAEHEMMRRMYEIGIPIPQPLEFGLCNDGKNAYFLSEWIDGKDAESVLPLMSETEQYVLGLKAGETLRKIHSLTVPDGIADWQERYFSVIDERIEAYRSEGTPFEGNKIILEYYDCNRNLLYDRPQCLLHGDFHEGNLMISDDGELYVIDLLDEGFGNYGDPWYDFKTFGENNNAYFSTGLIHGYFNGEPTQEFWDVLTYYIVTAAITSIVWMKYHKPDELPETLNWNEKNAWFLREGHSPLMKWYLPDFYIQYTDGVPYKLKTPFDFSFLSKYGKVFKVFDDQDSGNICFGLANGDNRYFIKLAGAPTERSCVTVDEAISNLKRTVPIYQNLAHPNLIKFISAEEIGGGFAMIFEWVDAECMHPMYPMSRKKFMQMTTATRLQVFDDIISFFSHVAKQGYVAIDFYDGSIMYDFHAGRTIICDIDLFEKSPYTNNMGRMWGSSRFMSPEEFTLGTTIDEITNVYTLGATAFALFGDESNRCIEKWNLSKEQFSVAKKAINDERCGRQQSIKQLIDEWRAVK